MVRLEWDDSCVPSNAWELIKDLDPPDNMRCVTVGFLLEETPEVYRVVQSIATSADGQAIGVADIVKCSVTKVEYLTPKLGVDLG